MAQKLQRAVGKATSRPYQYGMVIEVVNDRCTIQLTRTARLTMIRYVGSRPIPGERVKVEWESGAPIVKLSGANTFPATVVNVSNTIGGSSGGGGGVDGSGSPNHLTKWNVDAATLTYGLIREVSGSIILPVNNSYLSGSSGTIYRGTEEFLHAYNPGLVGVIATEGRNLFLGQKSGNLVMGGATPVNTWNSSHNTGIGADTLRALTIGYDNTAIGGSAMCNNTEGYLNTAIGFQCLRKNTVGASNNAFGYWSMQYFTIGYRNCAFGEASLGGASAGPTGNAYENAAFGHNAAINNIKGNVNSAFGAFALRSCISGSYNSAFGGSSLLNCSGSQNSAFGVRSLYNVSTGVGNVAVGAWSGSVTTTGSQNLFLGYGAGAQSAQSATVSNSIAIGVGAFTNAESQLRISSGSVEFIRGDISAGVSAIAFLGATPSPRIAHVADPSGGGTIDAEARTAINSILATLEAFGFHATS